MGYWVYIIQSQKKGSYYVGSTNNLDDRVKRHNEGRVKYTKGRGPWELVYCEEHPDRSCAMKREYEIKSRRSREAIETLVRTSRL